MSKRIQKRGSCPFCGRFHALNAAGRLANHGYFLRYGSQWNDCIGSGALHFGTEGSRDYLASVVEDWKRQIVWVSALPTSDDAKEMKARSASLANLRMSVEYCTDRLRGWTLADPIEVEVDDAGPIHLAESYGRIKHAGACVASMSGAMRFRGNTTDDLEKVTCVKCLKEISRREQFKADSARRAPALALAKELASSLAGSGNDSSYYAACDIATRIEEKSFLASADRALRCLSKFETVGVPADCVETAKSLRSVLEAL